MSPFSITCLSTLPPSRSLPYSLIFSFPPLSFPLSPLPRYLSSSLYLPISQTISLLSGRELSIYISPFLFPPSSVPAYLPSLLLALFPTLTLLCPFLLLSFSLSTAYPPPYIYPSLRPFPYFLGRKESSRLSSDIGDGS